MATLIDADKVKYQCSCERFKPLCSLYYCKYCKPLTLKCKECVLHEIDLKYFCSNCFDNKVLKEVMALKYKCTNCFSCPCCKNLLMTRASSSKTAQKEVSQSLNTSQSSPALTSSNESQGSSPSTVQKVFYLMCGYCRWSTRDVGIPDVTTAPGGWKLQENPNLKRIQELLDSYKILSAKEKLEKDKKKYPNLKQRRFLGIGSSSSTPSLSIHSDKYRILEPFQKKLTSSSTLNQPLDSNMSYDQLFNSVVKPAQTVDTFEELSQEFFTKEFNINSITTINQRHANPEFQPSRSIDLYPLNKHYHSKESKRCTGCEHNVLKPESNITSIKFKLHQMAIFLIPEVRIVTIPDWKLNEPNEVILSITNRYESDVDIGFIELESESIKNTAKIKFENISDETTILVDKQDSSKIQNVQLKQSDFDLKGFVCFRRDNRIAIRCKIIPTKNENQNEPIHVKCMFGLKCILNLPENPSSQSPVVNTTNQECSNRTVMMFKILIDFDPKKFKNSQKSVPRPRYIEDSIKTVIK